MVDASRRLPPLPSKPPLLVYGGGTRRPSPVQDQIETCTGPLIHMPNRISLNRVYSRRDAHGGTGVFLPRVSSTYPRASEVYKLPPRKMTLPDRGIRKVYDSYGVAVEVDVANVWNY